MMADLEIKHEFESNGQVQCCTCLSIGRKLFPLGKYANVYRRIIPEYCPNQLDIMVCWECRSLLCKVMQFQWRVHKAYELLQLGQNFVYGSLSNLATIIINDTHPKTIYVNSQINMQTEQSRINTKVEENKVDIDYENDSDGDNLIIDEDMATHSENIEIKRETDLKVLPVKRNKIINNKWAKKRALQNKKPKFKIVRIEDVKNDNNFRITTIKLEDLNKYMDNERTNECYKQKYQCESCVLGFKDQNSLIKHNENHHRTNLPFTCDLCNTTLSNKRHLSVHISNHFNKYNCTYCDYYTLLKTRILKHVKNEHSNVFVCLKCGLKYGTRREFFKHFKEWHEKFICDHCGVSFKMRYCIKDHIRKQHSPFECKACSKRFARYNGLWLHNKVRHTARAQPAYCVECDKRYPDAYRYRWHLANSARHRPRKKIRIPCPGCDKVFSKNIYMKDHYNLVHLKYYKYRCEECDKNFIRNADLVKHKKRVHEGILPPRNKICYVCGRGFTTNKILTNHVRTHTGERPFACTQCPAKFAQTTALAGHVRALHNWTHK